MASGGREFDGSDEEIRRPFKRKNQKILRSDSDEDSDFEVKPLHYDDKDLPLPAVLSDRRLYVPLSTFFSNKRYCKKILSSDSDEDSDFEVKPKRGVKPLHYESDEVDSCDEDLPLSALFSDRRFCPEVLTDLSDNEQSEKCSICLGKFLGQDIATPETCDHVFCLECLQEWAKNVNTCPIDRLKFNLILIRHHKEEKIIKTIFVNNSELPYNSESESESNAESQVNCCELCEDDDNEETLLLCNECQKSYHFGCVIPALNSSICGTWQCPACDNYIRMGDKFVRDVRRMLQGLTRRYREARILNHGRTTHSPLPNATHSQHSSTRDLASRFLYQKSLVRSILSTSDSSDEEMDRRPASSRLYQNNIATAGSKSRCPLLSTKRRNEFYRIRNQQLVSSTTAAASNSQSLYAADSDEGYSDLRLYPPAPENFDLVGSILQSQSLLHSPEVLTVSRDGTLLQDSKNGSNQTLTIDSPSPVRNSGGNRRWFRPFSNTPLFDPNSVSLAINNAVGKQVPSHSTQNSASKYGETPRQNYACSSSSAPRERSLSYDECILSGSVFNAAGNERYNNEPSSPIAQKSFCCTSTSDDVKKTASSNKDTKSHHSEDEVDIYSDIESVGEEDNSLSDKVEPVKMSYKCDESQLSDTNDVSDSTDNELVIDEDVPAEEDNNRLVESQGFEFSKNDSNNQEIIRDKEDDCCQADTDNDYPSSPFPVKNYDNYSGSVNKDMTGCDLEVRSIEKNESYSDNDAQESDMEMQDDENSLDSTRKSYQGCGSTSCSVKSSPKSVTLCENSISNENEFCENENSTLEMDRIKLASEENSNSAHDNTNDSVSQMEVDDFNEANSNAGDSESKVKQTYKHKKYNFCVTNERNYKKNIVQDLDSNENSQNDHNSNSSFVQYPLNNDRLEHEELAGSHSENNSHFSFASAQHNADRSEPEDGAESNDSNCAESQTENSSAFNFQHQEQDSEQIEPEEGLDSNENSQNDPHSNLSFSKYEKNADGSEGEELADSNDNTRAENNAHFGFAGDQQNADGSDVDDIADSNPVLPQGTVTSTVTTETINISNDETMKSDNDYEDCDSLEEASTPCLDENLEGEIENSPIRNVHFENDNQEFSRTPDYEYENESCPLKKEENTDSKLLNEETKGIDSSVDLGIEDISEAGSEDLDEFPEEAAKGNCNTDPVTVDDEQVKSGSVDSNKFFASPTFEDQEEGEIIDDNPDRESSRKSSKHDRYYDARVEYGERGPRMNISDLPRIPKLKKNREKDPIPESLPFDTKRGSVLSRVDLGAGDVSWKRLSKHTRERSYRDGRPKDERLLYRERESRNKDKNTSDNLRRNESKNSEPRRREEKKRNDRSKSDSRSRKNDKNKETNWDYSDHDKRKSHHKDRHSKEIHSKDKKDKHDKNRHSKEESKYEREKLKDDVRYEREARYDKEERFERLVYEKGKSKDKEHKNKRKERKSESSKSTKDHSREKHKHVHASDNFVDKQREREVRKVDDKLKIVVEQKDRKEKEKKENKYEKELHQRKRESERNAYSEMTSIESKEIFAKGDSIIINVNFNRASSPKDNSTSDAHDTLTNDQNLPLEELDQEENLNEETKSKSKNSDKTKSTDSITSTKRPATPPERLNQVLSVSESYWQGGDDPDGNNSVTSEKSEEDTHLEDENDTMESVDDTGNFTSSSNSTDIPATQTLTKEEVLETELKSNIPEEITEKLSKEEDSYVSKRRSPRSPSPPSPADNDSYDPCEPTKSPSPPPIPVAPPLPLSNPKPPPSPELPPLPPEPEPLDMAHENSHNHQNQTTDFNVPSVTVSTTVQPVTVETQTPSTLAFTGMMLPPPSFLSHSSQTSNSLPNISSLLPPRTLSYQMNSSNVMASNHMPPVIGGNFLPSQMHSGSTLPPPPNPPNIPHMTSVPPPPPPPSAMGLISHVRHPQLNVQPPLPTNSLLQNLNLTRSMSMPQLQLPPLPHLPPNLCAALANHHSPLTYTSQNQPTSLPCTITNQQGSRFVFTPNQMPFMPNQNMSNTKPHVMSIAQMLSHCQTIPVSSIQKSDQPSKPSTPAEKNEVIDMEVDSPYSPGDCSVDSVNDYSPTGSPLPSTPKETGDVFDTLFSADVRTSDKRPYDSASKGDRSKSHSGTRSANESHSKKSKHDHKVDSKGRHSVKMQIEKNKKARKEQKLAERISKLDDSQLKILDELPSSAVEMQVKEKFLKKLNRQERVVEEVKLALKPFYKSRDVNKEQYKAILRKAVPKICHNKSGEINPVKVKDLVESYIKKVTFSRKGHGHKKKSKFS